MCRGMVFTQQQIDSTALNASCGTAADGTNGQRVWVGDLEPLVFFNPMQQMQGSEVPGSGGGYCTHKRTHNVPMARKNGGKWGKMGGKWGKTGENGGK